MSKVANYGLIILTKGSNHFHTQEDGHRIRVPSTALENVEQVNVAQLKAMGRQLTDLTRLTPSNPLMESFSSPHVVSFSPLYTMLIEVNIFEIYWKLIRELDNIQMEEKKQPSVSLPDKRLTKSVLAARIRPLVLYSFKMETKNLLQVCWWEWRRSRAEYLGSPTMKMKLCYIVVQTKVW